MPPTPLSTVGATPSDREVRVTQAGALPTGARLGRYVVLRPLGSGGAGVVYEAFDPELGRDVAIKVLHDEAREQESVGTGRARLLREAQAMARVRHPNVVPVYDVGTFEGRVFVAMELVTGGTLRDWLRTPRATRDVVRVFVAAGRGLAGAHAAGLVHRDFKPDNVLVGVTSSGEEQVLVTDFGLVHPVVRSEARGATATSVSIVRVDAPSPVGLGQRRSTDADASAPNPACGPPSSSHAVDAPLLTQTGALLGTPGYMAPEQILLEPTDARTDQFAFCVSLYEALCDARPFPGDTVEARLEATVEGRIRPGKRRPSPRVARVLERGLSVDPKARFESMDALLAALVRDPMARARPWLLGASVALASVAAAALVTRAGSSRLERCNAARAHLEGVWDAPTKTAIAAAFDKSGAPFAKDAWRAVAQRLDAYGDAWAAMHKEACLAGVRGEQVPDVQTLRMVCLDERLAGLRATTSVLARGELDAVTKAIDLTGGLRPIETCGDVTALRTPVPLPDDATKRRDVQAIRARVETVRAELLAGNVAASLAAATALAGEAEATRHSPSIADATFVKGLAELMGGQFKEAEVTLEHAVIVADAARADHARAEAMVKLAFVTGYGLARRADGLRWGRLAEAAVARVGDRSVEADAAYAVAVIYLESGDRAKTLEQAMRAVRINEEVRGADNLLTVKAVNVLGAAYDSARDDVAAERTFLRAIATYERILGPRHPYIASPLGNLGLLYTRLGRYGEAVALIERSNAIDRDAFGPEHVDVAIGSASLSAALRGLGMYDASIAEADASIAIYEKTFGVAHVDLYLPLLEKGRTLVARGDALVALAPLERALRLAKPGEVDPLNIVEAKFALGRALMTTKRDAARGRKLILDARAELAASETPAPERMREIEAVASAMP